MRMLRIFAPLLAYFALIGIASAQEAVPTPPDSGDTAWMLTSTVLVLLMTLPGLALFYGGLVRAKNVLSILVQCFVMAALMSVIWVVYAVLTFIGWQNRTSGYLPINVWMVIFWGLVILACLPITIISAVKYRDYRCA